MKKRRKSTSPRQLHTREETTCLHVPRVKWYFTVDAGNTSFVPIVIHTYTSHDAIDVFMSYYGIRAYSDNIGVSRVTLTTPERFFEVYPSRYGKRLKQHITCGEFATV